MFGWGLGRSAPPRMVLPVRGCRYQLEECMEGGSGFKAGLWSANSTSRVGVVVDPEYLDGSSESFCVFALDNDVNVLSTERERALASNFIVERVREPWLHLLLIPSALVNRGRVTFREMKVDFNKLAPNAMLRCQLDECSKACPRKRLLFSCSTFSHCLCFEHLIPWDQRNDRPDLAMTSMYHEQMVAWAMGNGLALQGFETRVLLGFNYWLEGAGASCDQQIAVREFCEYDKWVCKLCKETKQRSEWSNTSFADIHKQLFPNGVQLSTLTANTASSIILHRSPQAYNELLKAYPDLTKDDIDYFLSAEDVRHIDLDLEILQVLLESARSSKPPIPGSIRRTIGNLTSGPQLNRDCFSGQIQVNLVCLESLSLVALQVDEDWSYEDLYTATLRTFGNYTDEDHLHFHRVEKTGCSTEISPYVLDASLAHVISVATLRGGDVLTIRRRGNIGVYNIGALYSEFSALHLLPTIDPDDNDRLKRTASYLLSQNYLAFRRIRGDGNCYYRAVIFGLLELITIHRRPERFDLLNQVFSEVCYGEDTALQSKHNRWLEFLTQCRIAGEKALSGNGTFGTLTIENAFINGFDLDHAAVRACRSIVSKYLCDNAETQTKGGLSMTGCMLPFYESDKDVTDMSSFCQKFVDRMETDAEGFYVQLGVLPHLLRVQSWVIEDTEGRNRHDWQVQQTQLPEPITPRVGTEKFGDLRLLLRPGHYDLLYTRDNVDKLENRGSLLRLCKQIPAKFENKADEKDKVDRGDPRRVPELDSISTVSQFKDVDDRNLSSGRNSDGRSGDIKMGLFTADPLTWNKSTRSVKAAAVEQLVEMSLPRDDAVRLAEIFGGDTQRAAERFLDDQRQAQEKFGTTGGIRTSSLSINLYSNPEGDNNIDCPSDDSLGPSPLRRETIEYSNLSVSEYWSKLGAMSKGELYAESNILEQLGARPKSDSSDLKTQILSQFKQLGQEARKG